MYGLYNPTGHAINLQPHFRTRSRAHFGPESEQAAEQVRRAGLRFARRGECFDLQPLPAASAALIRPKISAEAMFDSGPLTGRAAPYGANSSRYAHDHPTHATHARHPSPRGYG